MAHLSLETSVGDRAAVIALTGELDLAGAAALEHELQRLEGEAAAVVLDLRGVGFMDSSGLRLIAVASQRARELGRRLALVPGPDQVMRVFELTRMRERLDFVDDPSDVTVGGMRYEVELTRDLDSPAEARRALGEVSDHLPPRRLEDARLLVSELVTNAIRHAGLVDGDMIKLVVVTGDRALRFEVCDPGPGFEVSEPHPDPTRPSGWGLYLVRELSDRWGVELDEQTRVWFELDRDAA